MDSLATSGEEATAEKRNDRAIERGLLRRVSGALQFADFMAALMVASTALSAYATWRTASIANAIYLASERAYFGVESIKLDDSAPDDPLILVDYSNVGNVSAMYAKVVRRLLIGGREITSQTKVINPGILSPGVSHRFHLHVPAENYAAIIAGKLPLAVEVASTCTNDRQRPLCYLATFVYSVHERDFDITDGSADCSAQNGKWPTR